MVAVDTETTGLNPFNGARPFAISIYGEDRASRYIVIGEDDLVPVDVLLNSNISEVVFHNAKFDIMMLATLGMEVNGNLHDTMIMAHVYNPDESNKGLKHLAKKYLDEDNKWQKEVDKWFHDNKINKADRNYQDVPREIMEPYAVDDVRFTYGLAQFYKSKGVLEDPTYKKEMNLLKCLVNMQTRGVPIDVELCEANSASCEKRIAEIQEDINTNHKEMNVNSAKDLKEYLFDEEKIQCTNYTAKGNPSLDEYNLGQYDHPIIPKVVELRELTKLKSTYFDGLKEECDEEGTIHCDFFQVGAKTGRFSCRKPNLQNIPRNGTLNVRSAFVCRREYSNYYFDYSQIELRIFAHYAQEPSMLAELTKPDGDLHAMTAMNLFGEVDKEKRDIAKRLGFGIIYGIGANKFATILNQDYPDKDYNYTKASAFISKYYQSYPKISFFVGAVKRAILQRGFVQDIFERKYTCPKDQCYKAVNYLIQGCAAGVLKKSMIEIDQFLKDKKSNLLLTIHDELVIEIHKSEEDLVPQIKDIMEDKDTFRVPLTVNIEKTETNWSEKISLQEV